MNTPRQTKRGFTLIEVLVTIVIAAIAMAAILPFLGNVFLRSYEPRTQLIGALDLQSAMEELVALHTNDLENLKQQVGPENAMLHGRFRIVDNRYVAFSGYNESGSTTNMNLLKVTLQNDLGETVTRIFSVPL